MHTRAAVQKQGTSFRTLPLADALNSFVMSPCFRSARRLSSVSKGAVVNITSIVAPLVFDAYLTLGFARRQMYHTPHTDPRTVPAHPRSFEAAAVSDLSPLLVLLKRLWILSILCQSSL